MDDSTAYFVLFNTQDKEILRITSEGQVLLGEGVTMDEAAEMFQQKLNGKFREAVTETIERCARIVDEKTKACPCTYKDGCWCFETQQLAARIRAQGGSDGR